MAEAKVEPFKKKAGLAATLLSETRQHDELIDSISSVRLALVEDFWQDTLDFPTPDEEIWWEVWLRGTRDTAQAVHERFRQIATVASGPIPSFWR